MKKKVRLNNRTPLAMLKKQHDIINDVFIEKFGEPFRNAVFVIGESKMYRTDMFGPTFLIFPIGNFTFLWSPTVIDLNHKFDNEILIPSPGRPLKNLIMQFKNNLQNLSYTTENFETAIESGHEIMIRSKEYYAVSVEYYDINLLRRKLK